MSNIKIWHNPRCSKSRNTLALLEERGIDTQIIKYLETPHTKEDIKTLLKMLDIKPRELMRIKETIYNELNLKEEHNDEKLIEAMVENPKLIERPIVIKDNRAAIGRPIENIIELLEG